jgi:membrane fusion protein, copper/silver efflux system
VERARSLLESARERLRYWDLTAAQIDGIVQRGEPQRTVTIFAPVSGHLMTKSAPALEGMRVAPGMTILTIANHTKLWAKVALYENDIQHVREGMAVRVEVDAYPRPSLARDGRHVRPGARRQNAHADGLRADPNTDLKLRPGMYAQILIRPPGVSNAVKVPEQAILHSGERSVVIVQVGPGRFEPREVELGPIGGGFQEVRRGVEAGRDRRDLVAVPDRLGEQPQVRHPTVARRAVRSSREADADGASALRRRHDRKAHRLVP